MENTYHHSPSKSEIYLDYLQKKDMKSRGKPKKKKKRKKKKKYRQYYYDECFEIFDYSGCSLSGQPPDQDNDCIPEQLILHLHDPGFVFGIKYKYGTERYVGMPQDEEGNILIIGGNGSGKSAGIAKPTLRTWQGTMCVTDIKGELSDFYARLYDQGLVERPYIIFDPMQPDDDAYSYDPFYWLQKDGEENLVSNIWELVLAIIPIPQDDKQPFWVQTEQGILAAALLYYFQSGMSFSRAISLIVKSTVNELSQMIKDNGDNNAKMFLGEITEMKDETKATFDRGLRNKIMLFATDPHISHAFRGKREDAPCFTWDDLDNFNIFLRIPANRIEQWGGAINLMYTQLIRHLERRPDKYSPEGMDNIQTLLLMDEFARFGKLEMITNAMSTLRSKNVNICIMLQSMAQLDKIYGEFDRRIIFDNCQFQAILRANDSETQKYLSELIGTRTGTCRSISENMNEFMEETSYSRQLSEIREYTVYPHELSTLEDILLLTPYGFCRVDKIQLHNSNNPKQPLLTEPKRLIVSGTCIAISEPKKMPQSDENTLPDKNFEAQPCIITKSNRTTIVYCKATKVTCTNISAKNNKNENHRNKISENNEKSSPASIENPNAKEIATALKEVILRCKPLTKEYRKHRKN